jgi:hypothetical protein
MTRIDGLFCIGTRIYQLSLIYFVLNNVFVPSLRVTYYYFYDTIFLNFSIKIDKTCEIKIG